MPYEYPTGINFSNGFSDMFVYLNTVTASWFSNLLLVTIYIIFSAGFYYAKKDIFGAFAVGGFATFLTGLLMWTGNLISGITFTFVVAVSIVSFASLWVGHNQ